MMYLHHGQVGDPASTWVESQPLRRFDESYFQAGVASVPRSIRQENFSPAHAQESQARRASYVATEVL